MCYGEIVPSIPNLQLFHYMLAYGHSDGKRVGDYVNAAAMYLHNTRRGRELHRK